MEELVVRAFARAFKLVALLLVIASVVGVAAARGASGARGLPAPRMGATVDLVPVSGRIFVPVGSHKRLRGPRQVAIGSTVDTRSGSVRVIAAMMARGRTQTAEFSSGEIRLLQPRSAHGTLVVQLIGLNFATCKSGQAAHSRRPRTVRISTKSGYPGPEVLAHYAVARAGRSSGRNAVDASSQVVWDTIDACGDGTSIVVQSGQVQTNARGVPIGFTVASSQTIAYRCGSAPPVSKSYCAVVRGFVRPFNSTGVPYPYDELALQTRSSADTYSLRIDGPTGGSAISYPLTAPGPTGYRRSDVTCVPDQGAGAYLITWRVNGMVLATLPYQAPDKSPDVVGCVASPPGRNIPSDLSQQQVSPQGHFAIYYSTNPDDETHSEITDQQATSVLQIAERAYAYYTTALAMPTYLDGGDGKIDIYVLATISSPSIVWAAAPAGQSQLPKPGYPSAAYIELQPTDVSDQVGISEDVFSALSTALGRAFIDPALIDSAKVWAAANLLQESVATPMLSEPLDCNASCCGASCTENAQFTSWRFYQHLAERFGPGIVRDVIAADARLIQADPVSHMDQALQQVLASHGSSLAGEYAQYVLEDLTAGWQLPWVAGSAFTDTTGISFGALNAFGQGLSYAYGVDHLSAHILVLIVASAEPCVADMFTLDVDMPAGAALPGVVVYTGGRYVLPASALSATTQGVRFSFNSCNGAIVESPLVNDLTGPQPLTFTVSATLVRGS